MCDQHAARLFSWTWTSSLEECWEAIHPLSQVLAHVDSLWGHPVYCRKKQAITSLVDQREMLPKCVVKVNSTVHICSDIAVYKFIVIKFQDVRERYPNPPDLPYVGYIPTSGLEHLMLDEWAYTSSPSSSCTSSPSSSCTSSPSLSRSSSSSSPLSSSSSPSIVVLLKQHNTY